MHEKLHVPDFFFLMIHSLQDGQKLLNVHMNLKIFTAFTRFVYIRRNLGQIFNCKQFHR